MCRGAPAAHRCGGYSDDHFPSTTPPLCPCGTLVSHLGGPVCSMCASHSEGWLSLRGCIFFFKLTFVFNAFPQFQSYLCRVLQKPSSALLSRKYVWLLSQSVRLISLKNKALGLGVVGVVAKEASLVLQKIALPTKLLSFVIAKDKAKQTQICAVAPCFPCSL